MCVPVGYCGTRGQAEKQGGIRVSTSSSEGHQISSMAPVHPQPCGIHQRPLTAWDKNGPNSSTTTRLERASAYANKDYLFISAEVDSAELTIRCFDRSISVVKSCFNESVDPTTVVQDSYRHQQCTIKQLKINSYICTHALCTFSVFLPEHTTSLVPSDYQNF